MIRSLGLCLLCLGITGIAWAVDHPETEANDSKPAANAINLAAGDTISGTTTGNSTTVSGLGSADYFRVKTPAAAAGVYRHRVQLTSGDTSAIALTLRGLTQTLGNINQGTDGAFQSSSTSTSPPRYVQWYGFGLQDEIYLRVTGTASSSGAYVVTYTNDVAPVIDVGAFLEGPITIARGSGNTSSIDFWLYNGDFSARTDGGNAGALQITRTLSAGTYYVGISNPNVGNNLATPSDSTAVLDFPNAIANSNATLVSNMNIAITDVSGTVEASGAKNEPYQVVWYRFSVVASNVACCFQDGACQVQGVSACISAGGNPLGVGTNCSPNQCPQPGACCLPSGGCASLLESICLPEGGQFQGQGSPCPSNCESAQACCLAGNACQELAPFACSQQSGTSQGVGTSCTPSLCIPPGGSCLTAVGVGSLPFDRDFDNSQNAPDQQPNPSCNTGQIGLDNAYWLNWTAEVDCEVLVQLNLGYDHVVGVYVGDCNFLSEVACGDDPEPTTFSFNAAAGTTYFFQIGDYGPTPGGGPTHVHLECLAQGACCLPDGTCQEISSLACSTALGTFQGDMSTCAGSNCPPAQGCCFANQTCQDVTSARCSTLGGVSLGTGSFCGGASCVRGACCMGITCVREYEQVCVLNGGFYRGDTFSCDSVAGLPMTYTSNPNIPIPDSPAPAITDTIFVPDTYPVGDVNVHVVIPDHTYIGDLDIFVMHNGISVQLWSRDCGGNNGLDVTVDDEGNALICGQPTTGTFSTSSITAGQTLDMFDGQEVNGDWTISVEDQAGIDVGTLATWELIIDRQGVGVCFPEENLACCFSNGSCQFILPSACQGQGGSVLGLGTNCTPNACPQPQQCCLPDGSCQLILASTCAGQHGIAGGAGTSCSPNTCPPAQGCCIGTGGSCQDLVPAACLQANGIAQGNGTACAGNVCERGACCHGTTCGINYHGACETGGGSFVGANTNCGAVAGVPMTYTSNPNIGIVDPVGGVPVFETDTINVADSYTVGDVKVGLIIQHTYQGDLSATLTAPNGAIVSLIDRPGQPEAGTFGWPNDNYGNPIETLYFILSDDAADRYDVPIAPIDNPVGDWLPDLGPLSNVDGQPVTGDWTISIADNAGGDTGFLVSWELIIDQPGPGPCSAAACLAGDANCDNVVNNFDIDPFIQGVVNGFDPNAPRPVGYSGDDACWSQRFCWGDINRDTTFTNFDIDPYVSCIVNLPVPGDPCPPPNP